MTSIEWVRNADGTSGKTWNPTRGCSVISPGCHNCYAMRQAHRFSGEGKPYDGLTKLTGAGPQWTGVVRLAPAHILEAPLRRKTPTTYFVNSMSDLFHETLSNEEIAAVFGVMAAAPHHTFQVLTKRAKRMREWFRWLDDMCSGPLDPPRSMTCGIMAANHCADVDYLGLPGVWPLPNVWLGVSVEDQRRADERIPHLLETPAAVRFLSCEPLLGPVHLRESWLLGHFHRCPDEDRPTVPGDADPCAGCPGHGDECGAIRGSRVDWVIVGGESGPRARPFNLAWARQLVATCERTHTACFVKQLGAKPMTQPNGRDPGPRRLEVADRKGGDMAEWPEDLRVREVPSP